MSISAKASLTGQHRFSYLLALLLSLFSPVVLGNGVSVWDGEMPEEGLVVIPAEPEAYQPFTVVFTVEVPPGMEAHHAVHVDVIDHDALNNRLHQISEGVVNELIITHQAKPSGASLLLPLSVEIQGLPPGNLLLRTVELDNAGSTSVVNEKDLTIIETIDTQEIFLMMTRDREKFSMTASEDERDLMVRGPNPQSGRGDWTWVRELFLAWPAEGPAPDTAVPVCRFYSTLADSYFHTANEAECQALQLADSGWKYQGIEFRTLSPSGSGVCPAGTDPVWRLFNNRSDLSGINHRFTTLPWVYGRDVEKNWAGEGVAFCTQRSSPDSRQVPLITMQPAYLTEETEVSAILQIAGDYSDFVPSNIRVHKQPGEITIETGFVEGGFDPRVSYLGTVELGQLEPGDYKLTHVGAAGTDPRIEDEVWFTVYEAIPPTRVYTFFHPGINHYFVTGGELERQSVINNGWHATDLGFNVWPADGPAPRQAVPVCRFYSSLVNSHFYTASESECDYLQSFDSGWLYEGIAFQALVPREDGVCPAGTQPVWRLFNNRQDQQDSNHRFVVGGETYRLMVADGWAGEGVAFCSPPASDE